MKLVIDESTVKVRADVILADANTQYSRAALKKLFDMGNVTIDGELARPGDKPKLGPAIIDLLCLRCRPYTSGRPLMRLLANLRRVIKANSRVLACNRPST